MIEEGGGQTVEIEIQRWLRRGCGQTERFGNERNEKVTLLEMTR